MRILMLTQFYPPIIGGEEQHVRTLSVELVSRGHDVAVVTLWHQGLAEFELDRGVRVYRIRTLVQRIPGFCSDSKRPYAPPFPDPEAVPALSRIVQREQPEIVHAHNWLVYSFLPLKAVSRARLVVTLHNYNLVCPKTTLLYHNAFCDGRGMKKCLDCAVDHYGPVKGVPTVLSHRLMSLAERGAVDMFLTVSRAVVVGNDLVNGRVPFQVIPNFIPGDVNLLQGDSEPYLAQLPARDYLLFVGSLNRQKGVEVLMHAYAGLTNAPPLVLIGHQTPEWPTLSMDRPNNVFVLEDWPRHAVMEAWRRSIIALAPSMGAEGLPTAVMEAMSVGCPVIASRIGGSTDLVIDGETGLLIEPGDPSALREATERLLANPSLRREMGQAALRKVKEFRANVIVPRIEQVYEQVVG
jgi:glycosyltransferase involved in cell wall biosynthesis